MAHDGLRIRRLIRCQPRSWWWQRVSLTRPTVRPGREWIIYSGVVVHSSNYRNPQTFTGRRVLVIGFGNSGGEIALDLANAGVDVTMAVRSPVQIIPRDLLGFPILSWAILYRRLPARLVDSSTRRCCGWRSAISRSLACKRAAKGPRQMVEEEGRVPLIDIGTLAKIRDGAIKVRGGVDRFTADGVVFADGRNRKIRRRHSRNRLPPRSAPVDSGCRGRVRRPRHAAGRREQRPLCRGSTSAARSRCRPGSCGKSASRRSGSRRPQRRTWLA